MSPSSFSFVADGSPGSRVFELILRHFLACCSDDGRGSETSVKLTLGGESFSLSGLVIHEHNYLEVYPYDKWSDKNIPNFTLNEEIVPKGDSLRWLDS